MSEKEEATTGKVDSPRKSGDNSELLGKPIGNIKAGQESSSQSENTDSLVQQRRSRLTSSWAALQYIGSISKGNYVRLRVSDRLTSVAVLLASIMAVLSLIFHPLARIRLTLIILCDALVGIMILLYILNRLGILIVLPPREALLTWQIIVLSCVLGIFLTLNVGAIVAILILNPNLSPSH